ncbi:MAG TPA: hypothetical protein PLD14_02640 [Candidatus Pacearchaeota archaeon]|nr:hypothetical protein [Candidatus Pacearchaeota archaeon]HPR80099.1 hypothetical protein [Candidatus Pacearchaeota archaeon]
MNENEKGEIALKLLRNEKRKQGINLNPSTMKRGLGNLAKETGIPLNKLMEFAQSEAQRMLDDCFVLKIE